MSAPWDGDPVNPQEMHHKGDRVAVQLADGRVFTETIESLREKHGKPKWLQELLTNTDQWLRELGMGMLDLAETEPDSRTMRQQLAALIERYYRGVDPDALTRIEHLAGLLRTAMAANAELASAIADYAIEAAEERDLKEQAARVAELEDELNELQSKLARLEGHELDREAGRP